MEHKKEFKKIGFIFGLKKEMKLVSSTNNNKFCVNGISLTIAKYEKDGEIFTIAIIPHTWHNTNLNKLKIGDNVNLEADALIKYVEKLLLSNRTNKKDLSTNDITPEWLKENGW